MPEVRSPTRAKAVGWIGREPESVEATNAALWPPRWPTSPSAVKERRERQNRQFAAMLAAWNNQGAHFQKLAGVESVIERYIVPLALKEEPVLVIVLDGMSFAVCREFCTELAARRWTACSADAMEIPPAVTALPSVTEFSRYSLLSGALARGTQGAEELAWSTTRR